MKGRISNLSVQDNTNIASRVPTIKGVLI